MPLDLTLRVAAAAPADQTASFLRRAEAAGFVGVGLPDTQLIMRDVFVSLALAAERTSSLTLQTAVTNPVTRHLSVLGSLIQTVEELAPGRLRIIIGTGYSAVKTIGQRAATIDQMRETVTTLRALLSGQRLNLGGFEAHMPYASGRSVPIWIAGTGPKAIDLAGEVADGALLSVGLHPAVIQRSQEMIEAGAKRAGRDPAEIEVMYAARVQVEQDMETAQGLARPICAQWALEPYRRRWLQEAGLNVPDMEVPPELQGLYPDIPHAENWEEARRLTAFLSDELVAEICDALGLYGTVDHVVGKLKSLEEHGVKHLFIHTRESYALPEEVLTTFEKEIFPRLHT